MTTHAEHPEGRQPGELWREAIMALPNLVKLAVRLGRDPRVPMGYRLVALGAVGYFASPIDIIPDRIPVLGRTDDVLVLAVALHHLMEAAGPEIVQEHWDGSEDALSIVASVVEFGADLVPRPLRRLLARLSAESRRPD